MGLGEPGQEEGGHERFGGREESSWLGGGAARIAKKQTNEDYERRSHGRVAHFIQVVKCFPLKGRK